MKYDAVIFDLDGTLLNTLKDIADTVNAVLAAMSLPVHDDESYKGHVGRGIENLIRNVMPKDRIDEETIEAFKTLEGINRSLAHTKPYEGIPELLTTLSERGVKRAVLSNRPDESAKRLIARLLGAWRFDCICGARDGIPLKPDGGGACWIAGQLGIDPARCLFLGDSDVDMMAARDAGMYPVGALWGFRPAEELTASGAAELIKRPQDLLQVVE